MFPVTTQINEPPRTPRKRPRASTSAANSPQRSPRKASKKLERVLSLPLELVTIIFGYLLPADLVSVLHTGNKDVVRFLTRSDHGTGIWRAVRGNDPFISAPPCPPFMSEWNYTALLYKQQCSTCNNQSRTIQFECFVRCCGTCVQNPALYTPITEYFSIDPAGKTWQLLPKIRHKKSVYTLVFHPSNPGSYQPDIFGPMSSERKAQAKILEKWVEDYTQERESSRRDVSERRTAAILTKITAENSELSTIYSMLSSRDRDVFHKLDFMKASKEISHDDWPNILAKATTFLNELNLAAHYKALLLQLTDFYSTLPWERLDRRLLPGWADLCSFPEVRQVIDDHAFRGVKLESDTMENLRPQIRDAVSRWRAEVCRVINSKIPDYVYEPGFKGDLATVWFTSRGFIPRHLQVSPLVVQFPGVVRARYSLRSDKAVKLKEVREPADHMNNALRELGHSQPWLDVHEDIVFSTIAESIAREVVQLSWLDPATTLQETMDRLNPHFRCTCAAVRVYDWRGAVQHRCITSSRCGGQLVLLHNHSASPAGDVETQSLGNDVSCVRCYSVPGAYGSGKVFRGLAELRGHYTTEHSSRDWPSGLSLGVDFVFVSRSSSGGTV